MACGLGLALARTSSERKRLHGVCEMIPIRELAENIWNKIKNSYSEELDIDEIEKLVNEWYEQVQEDQAHD